MKRIIVIEQNTEMREAVKTCLTEALGNKYDIIASASYMHGLTLIEDLIEDNEGVAAVFIAYGGEMTRGGLVSATIKATLPFIRVVLLSTDEGVQSVADSLNLDGFISQEHIFSRQCVLELVNKLGL